MTETQILTALTEILNIVEGRTIIINEDTTLIDMMGTLRDAHPLNALRSLKAYTLENHNHLNNTSYADQRSFINCVLILFYDA